MESAELMSEKLIVHAHREQTARREWGSSRSENGRSFRFRAIARSASDDGLLLE
jgi:hypothetical protein